jgi:hypothetical protein
MGEKQSLPVLKEPEPQSLQTPDPGPELSEALSQIEAQELEERLRYLGYIE